MASLAHLSQRAAHAALKPPVPYYEAFMDAKSNSWSPTNRGGNMLMLVSENKLIAEPMAALLMRSLSGIPAGGGAVSSSCEGAAAAAAAAAADLTGYQNPRGRPRLRQALADFLTATCMKELGHMDGDLLSLSCGSGTVLDLLLFTIGDEGEGVLLLAPSYSGFDTYLQAHNSLVPVLVHLQAPSSQHSAAAAASTANPSPAGCHSSSMGTAASSCQPRIESCSCCWGDDIASKMGCGVDVRADSFNSTCSTMSICSPMLAPLGSSSSSSSSTAIGAAAAAAGDADGAGGGTGRGLSQQLECALAQAEAAGTHIVALMLSNPSNPQGFVYSRQEMLEMMAWAVHKGLHFISDEVYANSIFDDSTAFTSAAVLVEELQQAWEWQAILVCSSAPGACSSSTSHTGLPLMRQPACRPDQLVHVVWGISKDLGLSGLRVGCVYSRNQLVHRAFSCFGYYLTISSYTQWMLEQLLEAGSPKGTTLLELVAANKRQLASVYGMLTGLLDQAGVPYVPASAGVFIWLDLRSMLRESSWQEEERLWRQLAEEHHLFLSPGSAFHAAAPGFFRMCWAAIDPSALPQAVAALAAVKRSTSNFQAADQGPVAGLTCFW